MYLSQTTTSPDLAPCEITVEFADYASYQQFRQRQQQEQRKLQEDERRKTIRQQRQRQRQQQQRQQQQRQQQPNGQVESLQEQQSRPLPFGYQLPFSSSQQPPLQQPQGLVFHQHPLIVTFPPQLPAPAALPDPPGLQQGQQPPAAHAGQQASVHYSPGSDGALGGQNRRGIQDGAAAAAIAADSGGHCASAPVQCDAPPSGPAATSTSTSTSTSTTTSSSLSSSSACCLSTTTASGFGNSHYATDAANQVPSEAALHIAGPPHSSAFLPFFVTNSATAASAVSAVSPASPSSPSSPVRRSLALHRQRLLHRRRSTAPALQRALRPHPSLAQASRSTAAAAAAAAMPLDPLSDDDTATPAELPTPEAVAAEIAAQEALARDYQPELTGPAVDELRSTNIVKDHFATADEVFVRKTASLPTTFPLFRAIRGDGNCGWRAVSFSYFEALIYDGSKERIAGEQSRLKRLGAYIESVGGYSSYVYEDMAEEVNILFNAILDTLPAADKAVRILTDTFNDDACANAILYYIRLMTAAYLKENYHTYEGFATHVEGVAGYCRDWIERPNCEIDHLRVEILANILLKPVDIVLEVVYLDRSMGDDLPIYKFPDTSIGREESTIGMRITLLFRPDHYDIVYRPGLPSKTVAAAALGVSVADIVPGQPSVPAAADTDDAPGEPDPSEEELESVPAESGTPVAETMKQDTPPPAPPSAPAPALSPAPAPAPAASVARSPSCTIDAQTAADPSGQAPVAVPGASTSSPSPHPTAPLSPITDMGVNHVVSMTHEHVARASAPISDFASVDMRPLTLIPGMFSSNSFSSLGGPQSFAPSPQSTWAASPRSSFAEGLSPFSTTPSASLPSPMVPSASIDVPPPTMAERPSAESYGGFYSTEKFREPFPERFVSSGSLVAVPTQQAAVTPAPIVQIPLLNVSNSVPSPSESHPLRFTKWQFQTPEPFEHRETGTSRNSRFSTAHFTNPEFQPEEYRPVGEDGKPVQRNRKKSARSNEK